MNFDREKARCLMVVISGPLLFLNSVAYITDIMLNLKVLKINIELIIEQIFLLNYLIIFVSKPQKTTGMVIFLYTIIFSLLILETEDIVSNSPILKMITLISFMGLAILIFIEFKRSLITILAKD